MSLDERANLEALARRLHKKVQARRNIPAQAESVEALQAEIATIEAVLKGS